MGTVKDERMNAIIREQAAIFLERESAGNALITVTNVRLEERGKKALVFFTVFPTTSENGVLDFAKRKRSEFREFLQKESALVRLPFVDFAIDLGEKNRQKIDEISRS